MLLHGDQKLSFEEVIIRGRGIERNASRGLYRVTYQESIADLKLTSLPVACEMTYFANLLATSFQKEDSSWGTRRARLLVGSVG